MSRLPWCLLLAALLVGCGKKNPPTDQSTGSPDESPAPAGTGTAAAATDEENRVEAKKRLRELGLALHNHHDTVGAFPAGVVGKGGTLGLSWRVQLLPYLEQEALYKQFKLDEPWDSDHNKTLIDKMPKAFASPGKTAPAGKTYLRSFVGQMAFIPAPFQQPGAKGPPKIAYPNIPASRYVPGRKFTDITDGTSNTLAVVEAAEPVEWTKPDDLPFHGYLTGQPNPPAVPKLGGVFPDGFHGLMADGQVHFFPAGLSYQFLREVISVAGGEVSGAEMERVLFPKGRPPKKEPPATIPGTLPDAAARQVAVGRLRQVHAAALQFGTAHHYLPAGVAAKAGVGLSWRVQVLPYLGEQALYARFKLDEPWDSEANKKLLDQMPKAFESAGKPAPAGHTFLRTTTGPAGVIRTQPGAKGPPGAAPGKPIPGLNYPNGFLDGFTITILFAEAGDAVPWTKPDELHLAGDFFAKGGQPTVPKLGGAFDGGFHAVMGDGRVTFYKAGYPERDLFALLTPAGGEPVDPFGAFDQVLYSLAPIPVPPPK